MLEELNVSPPQPPAMSCAFIRITWELVRPSAARTNASLSNRRHRRDGPGKRRMVTGSSGRIAGAGAVLR